MDKTVTSSVFTNNKADNGGSVSFLDFSCTADVQIYNTTIHSNRARSNGGAFFVFYNLVVHLIG